MLVAKGVDAASLATLITAVASLFTVILASVALIAEGRRSRRSLGLENMWRLIEQWDHPDMRLRRASVARALLDDPAGRKWVTDEAIEMLNIFELLGYLVLRSRTLHLEDAWVNFSPWALSWWFTYERGIENIRKGDSTIFEDYAELVGRLIKYEARRRGISEAEVVPGEAALGEFLRAEDQLRRRLKPEEVVAGRKSWIARLRELG